MSDHAARAALSRMSGREVAIAAHYTGVLADLRALSTADPVAEEAAAQARRVELCTAYGLSPVEQRKPFAFSSGIAVIPVHGTLINRFGYSWGYVTGYNFVRAQVAAAGQDPDVMGIVFDMNSHGGEVAGCFEVAAEIAALAGGKPTLSVIDSNCYSACYALASGTDRIVATPSGGAGSIGVVGMHVSMEAALKDWGYKVTFVYAGDHKIDGNPYEDLPDSVRAEWQKSIDKSYGIFVAHVAKGRKMDEKAVRATQARTYRADDALTVGLIDAVASPQQAVLAFLGELTGSTSQPRKKEDAMSDGTKPGSATAGTPDQLAAERASAAAAERARIQGITSSDEAKGREQLAAHLAFKTSMSVEDAKAMLAAAPKADEKKAEVPNPLAAAMAATGSPNVGADGEESEGEPTGAQRIIAAARMAGVRSIEIPSKH